jgi:hypothetical protein
MWRCSTDQALTGGGASDGGEKQPAEWHEAGDYDDTRTVHGSDGLPIMSGDRGRPMSNERVSAAVELPEPVLHRRSVEAVLEVGRVMCTLGNWGRFR